MKEYNKQNLINIAVVALAALTVFFTVVVWTYAKGGWWAFPLPFAAIVYGVYCFVKKYLRKQ